VPSNHSVAYCRCQFWADCTTDTSGFSFGAGYPAAQRRFNIATGCQHRHCKVTEIVGQKLTGTMARISRFQRRRSSTILGGDPVSSKKPTRNLHGKKTEPSSDLSWHYREIGIKAVAAATHNAPHRHISTAAAESNRETENRTENRTKEDTDE